MGHAESKTLDPPPTAVVEDDLPQARIVDNAAKNIIDSDPSPPEVRMYDDSSKTLDSLPSLSESISPSVLNVPMFQRHPMSDYDFKKTLYE
jgi:hypothetical protein